MDNLTEPQKQCFEKIAPMVKDVFGDFAMVSDDRPVVMVGVGSAIAQVAVYPWGNDDATICTRAYVVMNVELTPDLMRYLLTANDRMRFGAFGVDDDGDIFFEHSIVGSTCDREELKASVMAVATTADRLDDEIVAKWGGERAMDKLGQ